MALAVRASRDQLEGLYSDEAWWTTVDSLVNWAVDDETSKEGGCNVQWGLVWTFFCTARVGQRSIHSSLRPSFFQNGNSRIYGSRARAADDGQAVTDWTVLPRPPAGPCQLGCGSHGLGRFVERACPACAQCQVPNSTSLSCHTPVFAGQVLGAIAGWGSQTFMFIYFLLLFLTSELDTLSYLVR